MIEVDVIVNSDTENKKQIRGKYTRPSMPYIQGNGEPHAGISKIVGASFERHRAAMCNPWTRKKIKSRTTIQARPPSTQSKYYLNQDTNLQVSYVTPAYYFKGGLVKVMAGWGIKATSRTSSCENDWMKQHHAVCRSKGCSILSDRNQHQALIVFTSQLT